MKIALINGSPKSNDSSSGYILHELKVFLENDRNMISEYYFRNTKLSKKGMEQLSECDVLVFAFPLYFDAIPSHLLNCLIQLEIFLSTVKEKDILVYTLVNCGLYEGCRNALAIEIMENWCAKTGLKWGQGIGIGSGAMLPAIKDIRIGHGPKRNLGKALKKLSSNILKCTSEENIYITTNLPRVVYKLTAEMGWRQIIEENGLRRRDLFLRK